MLSRSVLPRWLLGRISTAVALGLALGLAGCHEKTVHEWIADLESDDPYARQLALTALGSPALAQQDPTAAVRAVVTARDDDHPLVSRQALAAYFELRPVLPDALVGIACEEADAEWAARELVGLDGGAVAALRRGLADPGCGNRPYLARILAAIGAPAVPALLDALRAGDHATADLALSGLEEMGPAAREGRTELAAWAETATGELRARAERLVAGLGGR